MGCLMPSSSPMFCNVNMAIEFLSGSLEELTNLDTKDYQQWIKSSALGPLSPRSKKLQRVDEAIAHFFNCRDDLITLVKQYEKDPVKFNIMDLEDKILAMKKSIGAAKKSINEWEKSKRLQGKESAREEAVSAFSRILNAIPEFLTKLTTDLQQMTPEKMIFVSEALKEIKKLSEEKNENQLRIVLGNANILLTELRTKEQEMKKILVDNHASAKENILQEIKHLTILISLLETALKQNKYLIESKREATFDTTVKNTKSSHIQWSFNTERKISDPYSAKESKLSEDYLEDKRMTENDVRKQLAKVPQKSALKHETKRDAENYTSITNRKIGK